MKLRDYVTNTIRKLSENQHILLKQYKMIDGAKPCKVRYNLFKITIHGLLHNFLQGKKLSGVSVSTGSNITLMGGSKDSRHDGLSLEITRLKGWIIMKHLLQWLN